jgi:transcriptional regulator with XRE-family HTH domain
MGTMIKSIHHTKYQALLEYLKNARLERGLTVRDLAVLIDEPFQFISKVETGQRRLTVHEYVQYCEALDLNPIDGIKLLVEKNSL